MSQQARPDPFATGDLRGDPSSSLQSLLRWLRRRAWIIALCVVIVPGVAYALSASQEEEYSASASLLFRQPSPDERLFRGSSVDEPSSDPGREAATNLRLVSLDRVAERTARALDARLTGPAVATKIEVEGEGEADIVNVTATDGDPAFAAELANTFARQYIGFRRESDRTAILRTRDLIQRRLGSLEPGQQRAIRGRNLRQRSEELEVLASLQTGNARLVQPARVPASATSPKPRRSALLGVGLGLLLGLGLAFLLELLDRRLKDPKEIEELFDRPTLGAIPESRGLAEKGKADPDLRSRDRDAFRMLRANLRYFNVDREIESVLITSAGVGDGKTTVAWNLAVAAAETGAKVLLVEADMRSPRLALRFDLPTRQGLSDVLTGHAEVGGVIYQVVVANRTNGGGSTTLMDVLVAGPVPPNPTDLIESKAMRKLVRESEDSYDLVVIDPPPTSIVSDAVPLMQEVSGILVVSRIGKSTRDAAQHLQSQLHNLDVPVLGIVINGVREQGGYYGGQYGYAVKESRRVGRRTG